MVSNLRLALLRIESEGNEYILNKYFTLILCHIYISIFWANKYIFNFHFDFSDCEEYFSIIS